MNIEIHRGKGHSLHILFGVKMNRFAYSRPCAHSNDLCKHPETRERGRGINLRYHSEVDVRSAKRLIKNGKGASSLFRPGDAVATNEAIKNTPSISENHDFRKEINKI